jgi:hypothetical protein
VVVRHGEAAPLDLVEAARGQPLADQATDVVRRAEGDLLARGRHQSSSPPSIIRPTPLT